MKALLCAAFFAAWPASASAMGALGLTAAEQTHTARATHAVPPVKDTSVVLAFLPSGAVGEGAFEAELASVPGLSIAILSATQGAYSSAQLVLDITQGARVSLSAYEPAAPPLLSVAVDAGAGSPTVPGGQVGAWAAVLSRAHSAPQLLDPGLLAAQIPGGGAYVPADGVQTVDGIVAADRGGHLAAVLSSPSTLLSAIHQSQADHRLVVADLPAGQSGYGDLRALADSRPAGELLIVVQRVTDEPDNATAGQAGHDLLWIATSGLGAGGETLSSQSTNQSGLVAAIDIGPTILAHLRLPIPAAMRGKTIRTDGPLDSAGLRGLKRRLEVLDARRLAALAWLLIAWVLLLALARLTAGPDGRPQRTAWAMRTGALAMLWTPSAVLVSAALEPSRTVEFAVLVAVCFGLAALTERLLRWPRAPIAPALVAMLALSIDALAGTQLLMRSLLGPNPAFGARFYGIGNELKSGLAVLLFTAVAAALYPSVRGRRASTAMACAGVVLAVIEGSARIGAGVGGVILVSAGTAVATVMLLAGTLNRKRVLVVMAAPIVGLVALAALDLATAHGSGHFTGSVLDARSAGDIRDVIVRRYGAAYGELTNHLMPLATGVALIVSVMAIRRRELLCAPVDSDPAWLAALAGGLTAGVIGALSEDSGPVLLVVAVFTLGCVLSYLWSAPPRVSDTAPLEGLGPVPLAAGARSSSIQ